MKLLNLVICAVSPNVNSEALSYDMHYQNSSWKIICEAQVQDVQDSDILWTWNWWKNTTQR
jgi:hypothetical protein